MFFQQSRQLTIKDVANQAPGSGGGSARATANGAERREDTGGGETGRGGVRGIATTKQIYDTHGHTAKAGGRVLRSEAEED